MTRPEMTIAEAAAKAGGEVAARYFRDGVTMRSKDVSNLVSDADVEAEHAIAAVIRAAFPDHAILGEEAYQGDASAEHLWVVDPIDGTNNFAHAIPHFAVSVAYYHQGVAQCGVILNPVRDEWHTVVRGQGAFHDGRPAKVQETSRLDEVIVGVGFYYDRGAMMEATLAAIGDLKRKQIHGIRRFGTASLDLCAVGSGSIRGVLRVHPLPLGLRRRPPLRRGSRRARHHRPRRTAPAGQNQRPRHQRSAPPGDAGGHPAVSSRRPGLSDQPGAGVAASARFPSATGKIGGRTVPVGQP